MDAYMITFRIIHIVSAILWVGSGVFFVAFVGPTFQAFGPEGGKFFAHLVRRRKATVWFVIVSTFTVVAGAFLYWRNSAGLRLDWIRSSSGIGFTIGAIAGIIAWLLVLLVLTPAVNRLLEFGGQIAAAGGPPTQEQMMTLQAMQSRQRTTSYVIVTLILFAAVAMATARYLVF